MTIHVIGPIKQLILDERPRPEFVSARQSILVYNIQGVFGLIKMEFKFKPSKLLGLSPVIVSLIASAVALTPATTVVVAIPHD